MANILLTQKCNQKCAYCFASYTGERDIITIEDFEKAVDFITRKNEEKIGLLGGEPLLHPDFSTICNILQQNNRVKYVIVYTNGLLLDQFLCDMSCTKFGVLINCNEASFYTRESFSRLKSNIAFAVSHLGINNVQLGINIYKRDIKLDEIYEILKNLGMRKLRISLAIPKKIKITSQEEQFNELKETLFLLFDKLASISVLPQFDCSVPPLCFYTSDEIDYIKRLFGNGLIKTNLLSPDTACSPVLDIYPDLSVCRCFGFTKERCNLLDFRNTDDIRKYFFNKVDKYFFDYYSYDRCNKCYLNKTMNCLGGCLSYQNRESKETI